MAMLYLLELPSGTAARPRSPLEGLRLPKGPAGAERGRTGALPLLVLATAAVAGAIGAAAPSPCCTPPTSASARPASDCWSSR